MKNSRPIKAIGSKRRAAGWMLLTLGVLVAGVWVWSGFHSECLFERKPSQNWLVQVKQGQLKALMEENVGYTQEELNDPDFFEPPPFVIRLNLWRPPWSVNWNLASVRRVLEINRTMKTTWTLALWPLPILLWTTGGLALWSGRRARRRALEGHCPTCGYNLAGLNRDAGVGVCPECGKAKAAT